MKMDTNAPTQRCVFMKEPPEYFADSAYLGPDSCFVRGEGFESCLSIKIDSDTTLSSFLNRSQISSGISVSSVSVSFYAPGRDLF